MPVYRRVGIGLLMQESNSFAPHPTTWEDFAVQGVRVGVAAPLTVDGTEWGGMVYGCHEAGLVPVPLVRAWALAGGPVTPDVVARLATALAQGLDDAGPLDGLLLALHGAMIASDDTDPEVAFLQMVRNRWPRIPLGITCDLHAHLHPTKLRLADFCIAYQTYPHDDTYATGCRAAATMARVLNGEVRPVMAHRHRPILFPPDISGTAAPGCLAPIANWARAREKEAGVLHISYCPVQPWLDVPNTGSSVVVVTDGDWMRAEALAAEGAALLEAQRPAVRARQALSLDALPGLLQSARPPIVLGDIGDGTAGGGSGDHTGILTVLLAHPLSCPAYVPLVDAAGVRRTWPLTVGAIVDLTVGATLDPRWSSPVRIHGRVVARGDGPYILEGPYLRGHRMTVGRWVRVAVGTVHVLLTERAGLTSDPAFFTMTGATLGEAGVIVVKSPLLFRRAFSDIARTVAVVDTLGPTASRFAALPFRRISRPMFPLDDDWKDQS